MDAKDMATATCHFVCPRAGAGGFLGKVGGSSRVGAVGGVWANRKQTNTRAQQRQRHYQQPEKESNTSVSVSGSVSVSAAAFVSAFAFASVSISPFRYIDI